MNNNLKNIRDVISRSAEKYPENLAFKVKMKEKTYDDITYTRLKYEVESIGK